MGRDRELPPPLEITCLNALWEIGEGNVEEVRRIVSRERPLAYTTVQTMLNILERKGKLKRKLRGRAYVYSATVTEAKASRHAVRDLVDRVFGGSTDELVMSLIKSRQIDPRRIAELSRKLEEEGGDA